jgi:predicted lipoprotein with Yx(FWY)xxD motif
LYSLNSLRISTLIVLAAAAALLLSACGGGSNSNGSAATSNGSGGAQTVAVKKVSSVGDVLVDSKGKALYFAAQEAGGKMLCTGSCTSIWLPLTLPAGDTSPTATADLGSRLGVVKRPGGAEQVTFKGAPLYRFADDAGPGTVSGDGLSDSFDGRDFTWHVAKPAVMSGGSSSTSPSGGYGY